MVSLTWVAGITYAHRPRCNWNTICLVQAQSGKWMWWLLNSNFNVWEFCCQNMIFHISSSVLEVGRLLVDGWLTFLDNGFSWSMRIVPPDNFFIAALCKTSIINVSAYICWETSVSLFSFSPTYKPNASLSSETGLLSLGKSSVDVSFCVCFSWVINIELILSGVDGRAFATCKYLFKINTILYQH